jgi:hypothetical protein
VPAIFASGQLIVGYSAEAQTDQLIRNALAGRRQGSAAAASAAGTCPAGKDLSCKGAAAAPALPETLGIEVPGRTTTLDELGLPLFSLTLDLPDGFNPARCGCCS